MKTYSLGLIGLAVLVASSLMGQMFALGGESCQPVHSRIVRWQVGMERFDMGRHRSTREQVNGER